METLEMLIKKASLPKKSLCDSKTQLRLSEDLKRKRDEIISAYGDRKEFLLSFNPDMQKKYCSHEDICFFGDIPTLANINTTYGANTAAMFLVQQLFDLSEYTGVKGKLTGKALEGCANAIVGKYYYLKVSEIMMFFKRFKEGRYGVFYGAVDPLVIMNAMSQFLMERSMKIEEHAKQVREEEEQARQGQTVTYDEYCIRTGIKPQESALYRLLHSKTTITKADGKKSNRTKANVGNNV